LALPWVFIIVCNAVASRRISAFTSGVCGSRAHTWQRTPSAYVPPTFAPFRNLIASASFGSALGLSLAASSAYAASAVWPPHCEPVSLSCDLASGFSDFSQVPFLCCE